MPIRVFAISLALAVVSPAAQGEIYECIDESGNKRFTNIKSEAKGCKALAIAPPSPAPAPAKPQPKPAAPSASAPQNFPKVDPKTQRDRDADRRRILEQELANEQRLLEPARAQLSEQESIRLGSERNYQRVLDRLEPFKKKVKLHEDNVANLRRELSNLR